MKSRIERKHNFYKDKWEYVITTRDDYGNVVGVSGGMRLFDAIAAKEEMDFMNQEEEQYQKQGGLK